MTARLVAEKENSISFPVTGMTCAACQARVQRALTAEHGVIDASVNLVTRSAAVRYDPAAVTPQELIEAVRATGYDAELPAAEESPLSADRAREETEVSEALALAVRARAVHVRRDLEVGQGGQVRRRQAGLIGGR